MSLRDCSFFLNHFFHAMNPRLFRPLIALGGLFQAPAGHAQFELKGGTTNWPGKRRAGAPLRVDSNGMVTGISSAWRITNITVRGGGSGYRATSAPAVSIAAPAPRSGLPPGTTAATTATATVNAAGAVTADGAPPANNHDWRAQPLLPRTAGAVFNCSTTGPTPDEL